MKKNAIIDIINNDLSDIQMLISTFKSSETIPAAFIDVLHSKYTGLGKSIALLDFWKEEEKATDNQPEASSPQPTPEPQPASSEEPTPEPKEEPAPAPAPVPEVKPQPEPTPEPAPASKSESKPAPKPASKSVAPSKPAPKHSNGDDIITYGAPVTSVIKAFGTNDRFLYPRELYGGNRDAFNYELAMIDTLSSYDEALEYLRNAHPEWDMKSPLVTEFLHLIHRRFI